MSKRLRAVIFDVDGTLFDSERHGHLVAFNMAFVHFDLPYRWDVPTYGELLKTTGGKRRLKQYLATQGIGEAEAEAEELAGKLHKYKTEVFKEMAIAGEIPPRPGAIELIESLQNANVRLAVATTGSREWVVPLLNKQFGPDRFELVVTGEDVTETKPDPEVFNIALTRLQVSGRQAIVVEDSDNGLEAAKAANGSGLITVMVVNEYTKDQDLVKADLILDDFGTSEQPAQVLHDPHRLNPPGYMDADILESLIGVMRTAEHDVLNILGPAAGSSPS